MFSKGDAYEQFMGRWSRVVAPAFVAFAEVRDGDAVLDVGSGTGVLSFAVRDATTNARVTGIDPSPDYVAHATQMVADPRVAFDVGDAEDLDFADGTFDKTVSLLVLNFVPDRTRALKEWIRVTKPCGLVAAAVWDYGEGMQMLRTFWDEATALEPSSAPRDEAHMPLCRRGELAELWRREGLQHVIEAPLTVALRFASFDDYWTPFKLGQGPAGAYVAGLTRERQTALEERLRRRWLDSAPDRPITMQARAWAVKGIVPER